MSMVEINKNFQKYFKDVPATLLFEKKNVEDIAKYFLDNHREELEMKIEMEGADVVTNLDSIF